MWVLILVILLNGFHDYILTQTVLFYFIQVMYRKLNYYDTEMFFMSFTILQGFSRED